MKVKMKFTEMDMAFDYASADSPGMTTVLLDTKTGEFHCHSELIDLDPLPEELYDSEDTISIPHKNDLDMGRNLVFEFAAQVIPDELDRVEAFFSRRGAYRRFKDLLEYTGHLQEWYDYEGAAREKAMRAWCEENEIELID